MVRRKGKRPALYIAGDRDLVVRFRGMDRLIPNLDQFVPQLRVESRPEAVALYSSSCQFDQSRNCHVC
jgi:hypothetical protein